MPQRSTSGLHFGSTCGQRVKKVHLCTMSEVRHRSPEHASRPVVVGVTGGMAAGKSLVTRMFGALGAPTWDADFAAKRLYQTDATLQQATLDRWGPRIAKVDECGRMVEVDREA